MTRHSRRAIARTVARPTLDPRWLALAAVALAGVCGAAANFVAGG